MTCVKVIWVFCVAIGSVVYRPANSQGCLDRWFELCGDVGGTVDVCTCVLHNDPKPVVVSVEDSGYCTLLNNSTECCSEILVKLLEFYQPLSADDTRCTEGSVFSGFEIDATKAQDPGFQYIVPDFKFSCDGCIEEIEVLVEPSQQLTGEILQVQLWSAYEPNSTQNEFQFLYKQRAVFNISVGGSSIKNYPNSQYQQVTIPVSESKRVCFQSGDVFGFSQPDGSNLKIIFSTSPSSYRTACLISPQMPECGDLQGFFELSDECEREPELGIPQLVLKIVPEPTITTVLPMPVPSFATQSTPSDSGSSTLLREHQSSTHMLPQTTSIQFKSVATEDPVGGVTYTSLPVATEDNTGGVKGTSLPSSAPEKEEKEFDLIIVVAASAGGAVILILVVVIPVLVVCMLKRHRPKKKPSFMYEPTALGTFPLSDGRFVSADNPLSEIRSPMMDSLINDKYESLTVARAAAGFPERRAEALYDLPEELGQHPHSENMDCNNHNYQDVVESPDDIHNNVYSGKYVSMKPASEDSRDWSRSGQGAESGHERDALTESMLGAYDVPSELDHHKLTNHPSNYDIPRELAATNPPTHPELDGAEAQGQVDQTSNYDVPRELAKSRLPVPHVYRVLEDPTETRRDRSVSCDTDSVTSETSGSVKHQYHILENGGGLPSTIETAGSDAEGYSSSLVADSSIQRAPSHRQLVDCGIYVPNTAERKDLTGKKEDAQGGVSADPYETWTRAKRTESTKRRGFFEESRSFWKPATVAEKLYDQFAAKKFREILRDQIQIIDHLGAGQFGSVNKAMWNFPAYPKPLEVAVKMMRPSALKIARVKFLQEAAIMGQFFHPNVVKLHGVVTVGEPAIIVLELMQNGDLNTYLRKHTHPRNPSPLTPTVLLSFSRQTASGMKYLAKKKYVHRDLAARNILLSETLVCKISDFGMSRGLDEDSIYYMSKGGQVPIKWTAPEALLYKKYSTASDVYSYGMLMFEIWSLGLRPLSEVPFQQVASRVSKGYCQAPPPGTPRAIYRLMVQCWNPNYNDRPTFSDITDYLGAPDESLLAWSSKDKAISKGAAELGSPLDEGRNLYTDLQHCYGCEEVVV